MGPIVPDGLVYVVRDIDAVHTAGSSSDVFEVIGQALQLLWFATASTSDANGGAQWRGRQVFNEGEQVGFKAVSGTWDISCSGYQLTLP